MEPFATIADLNARRASGIPWRTRVAMGAEPFASNLRAVCCAMVERAVEQPLPLCLKSQQGTAGPYSFTSTAANPGGDVYLLASERRTLGIGQTRVGFLRPRRDAT